MNRIDKVVSRSPHGDVAFRIPEKIAGMKLSLPEKVALSIIHHYPRCSNAVLMQHTCLSSRGIENLLNRLRGSGLLKQIGKGCGRSLRLMFPVEHHTLCETNDDQPKRMECGPSTSRADLAVTKQTVAECSFEYFDYRRGLAANCMAAQKYDAAIAHLAELRRIASRDLVGKARDKILAILADDVTVAQGLKLIDQTITSRTQRTVAMAALARATSEQLADLRQRIADNPVGSNAAAALISCP